MKKFNFTAMILKHILKVYLKLFKASFNTFGLFSKDFAIVAGVPFYLLFTHTCMLLDNLFFPAYKKVEIKNPIFIIGHPRSGTTFFHRLMIKTDEYLNFKSWQLFFPSLTARKLVKPIIDRKIAKGNAVIFPPETGHYARLDLAEEEEQLFMHYCDSQFTSIIFSLGFSKYDFDEILFNDEQKHQKKSLKFFKNCLKRQIYYTGNKQVVARCNFSGMRIQHLAKAFPDAKFIYFYRNPLESIPSHLSLNHSVFDYKWGLDKIGQETMQRYFNRRYRYNVIYYKYMENILTHNKELNSRVLQIYYPDLLANFEKVMKDAKAFMNIEISDELNSTIEEQAEKQKSYKRKHKVYELSKFGLSETAIKEDLAFMFKKIDSKV